MANSTFRLTPKYPTNVTVLLGVLGKSGPTMLAKWPKVTGAIKL